VYVEILSTKATGKQFRMRRRISYFLPLFRSTFSVPNNVQIIIHSKVMLNRHAHAIETARTRRYIVFTFLRDMLRMHRFRNSGRPSNPTLTRTFFACIQADSRADCGNLPAQAGPGTRILILIRSEIQVPFHEVKRHPHSQHFADGLRLRKSFL
jgi:hypothetical protein